MKKHIHILGIIDFYLSISKKDPDAHRVIVEEYIKVNKDSFDKEGLRDNLDKVNMWIGNCDQKASIVLAVLGVVLTILFTGDFVKHLRHILLDPIQQAWPEICGVWNVWQWVIMVLLMIVAIFGVSSVYHLLFALRAKTDLRKLSQEGMQSRSMLHYEEVAKRAYKEYCEEKVDLLNDLRTQVYVNSCICSTKFNHYKKGIRRLELALAFGLILGGLIFIY